MLAIEAAKISKRFNEANAERAVSKVLSEINGMSARGGWRLAVDRWDVPESKWDYFRSLGYKIHSNPNSPYIAISWEHLKDEV